MTVRQLLADLYFLIRVRYPKRGLVRIDRKKFNTLVPASTIRLTTLLPAPPTRRP
jgi:hypothetical protein